MYIVSVKLDNKIIYERTFHPLKFRVPKDKTLIVEYIRMHFKIQNDLPWWLFMDFQSLLKNHQL